MDLLLIRVGLAIFAILGSIHLIYTLLDLTDPKRFVPADRSVLAGMQASKTRFPSMHNYWRSSLGFHLSHSLGLIIFALIFVTLSFVAPGALFTPAMMIIMVGTGTVYAVLSHYFWFSIPLMGSILGTGLIGLGFAVHG